MEEILQWLTMNIDKLFLYIGGSTFGGISLWKIFSILVALIKNHTAKKYTKKQEEYTKRVENAINGIKEFVKETIKEEVKIYADTIKGGFNELQQKTQAEKQKIYNEIFNKKQEVIEIVQDIKEDIKNEIEEVTAETEEIPEVIEEKETIIEEEPNNKIDLL